MLPAINRTIGKNIGFPDPCATPVGMATVVIPYPNIADHGQAILFSPNVKVSGAPALNLGSKIPITTGDEGGVAHPFIKQLGQFSAGNPIVKINFLPGICLLCPSTGNNMNNGLGAALVPPVVNVFYTYSQPARADVEAGADRPIDGELGCDEIAALADELRSAERGDGAGVTWSSGPDGVGRIAVPVFSADVPARVFSAVERLLCDGLERLVIDLRGNPGGELVACAELLGDFFPAGTELFTFVDAAGDETAYRGWNERPYRFDLTLLVDRRTASAAELFATALAARGRAVVLGGPMSGKDTIQTITAGPSGRPRRVTVGRWRVTDRPRCRW